MIEIAVVTLGHGGLVEDQCIVVQLALLPKTLATH